MALALAFKLQLVRSADTLKRELQRGTLFVSVDSSVWLAARANHIAFGSGMKIFLPTMSRSGFIFGFALMSWLVVIFTP